MTSEELAEALRSSGGRIVSVRFTKRTTGEERLLVGRLGVTSHLRGGGPAYDFVAKGLVCIFDMVKGAFRSIPIEGILEIRAGGETLRAGVKETAAGGE